MIALMVKGTESTLVAASLILTVTTQVWAQDETNDSREDAQNSQESDPQRRDVAKGVLPQLGVALKLPDGVQLYNPEGPRAPDEPLSYNRLFPIGAEKLINQGYALPLPGGISVIGIHNRQGQRITDLSVAMGKGVIPPEGEPLVSIPFVDIDSFSVTNSGQVKADIWVLPFLNIFGTVGKVEGEADLKVNINLDDVPTMCVPNPVPSPPGQPERPPICIGNKFDGTVTLPLTSGIDLTSLTLGATGAYSVGSWFGSLTASATETYGDDSSDIKSLSAGFRAGRRFAFGNGHIVSPYTGISYLDIDTRISGTATLEDAFSDGDELSVRYDAYLENLDKFAGVLGINVGFRNGTSIMAELNKSARSERILIAGQFRF